MFNIEEIVTLTQQRSGTPSLLDDEDEFWRNEGLRIVIESKERSDPGIMRNMLDELFIDRFVFDVQRLFAGAEDTEPLREDMDLAKFWLLKIPGINFFALEQNIFDFCYLLQDLDNISLAEPDMPFVQLSPDKLAPLSSSPVTAPPTLDRAWSLRNIKADKAWDYSDKYGKESRGAGILIGHPDTGYAKHDDLDVGQLKIRLGKNFIEPGTDPEDPLRFWGFPFNSPGHGTATGSVIMSDGEVTPPPPPSTEGGTSGPGKVTGVAPKAELVPIRAAKVVWLRYSSDLAAAIDHAVNIGCKVISISLGGYGLKALKGPIDRAVQNNCIVVAAAGNYTPAVVWPARYKRCIALAASNFKDKPWLWTSRGCSVDISAPGNDVWRAYRRHPSDTDMTKVDPSDGTSYATACAAGAAACWLAHHGAQNIENYAQQTSVQEIFRDFLKNTARTPAGWDNRRFGAGIVNVLELLRVPIGTSNNREPEPPETIEDEILSFFEPIEKSSARKILSDIVNVNADEIANFLTEFGSEIRHILFQLSMDTDLVSRNATDDPFYGLNRMSLKLSMYEGASRRLKSKISGQN